MKESKKKEQGQKKVTEVKTFPVPFSSEETKENITVNTNTASQPSKEQIINQAIKFHLQGNIPEAVKYYQYFINQRFKDHRVFSNYGVILRDLGKPKEAEISYRKAIEIKPDYAEAHSNLGNILRDLGKPEEAEISYRKAIQIKPDYAEAHSNLGNIFRDLEKFKEAELSIRKAIKIKPDFYMAHRDLGICLYLMGDIDSALESIVKANSLDPKELGNRILLSIFQKEKNNQNRDLKTNKNKSSLIKTSLDSNPLILNMPVEIGLIDSLYKIKVRDQEKYQAPTYGEAKGSDYKLFERKDSIIKTIKEKLTTLARDAVKSDVLITESFFTIFRSGGGLTSHDHLSKLDKIKGINIASKKFSLVYYLTVGDQNCDEPGILKLENPNQDILPSNGLIIIFPAGRKHSVLYKGKKDRIIIGVNFYSV